MPDVNLPAPAGISLCVLRSDKASGTTPYGTENQSRIKETMKLIDSHCHLDMIDSEENLDGILAEAAAQGVEQVVTIGIDAESSRRAVELAGRFPSVSATVGVHPHDAAKTSEGELQDLTRLAQRPEVVAWGEIGLDYAKNYAPPSVQREIFALQLDLARKLNLPVVIHDREAHQDTLDILRAHGPYPAGGVMHCFSGDMALADQVMDLGFHISIPGIVTFKNAARLREVARRIPLSSLILETDAPFLAPVPMRGKSNRPSYLVHTARCVAQLRDISMEELARATTANCTRLFARGEQG